jgi:hypothetical protein
MNSQRTDWLPAGREDQLSMAKGWKIVLDTKANAWGVPPASVQELDAKTQTADTALATAKNETTRTPVATAHCKTAFEEMIAVMRHIKRKYFTEPELTEADFISLGLKIPDTHPTASGTPTAQATIETFLVGRHELGVKIIYLTGNPGDPANKGYRIWYKVIAPGEAPPTSPEDLPKSFSTKRKRDVMEFDFGASGSTCCMAVQIENESRKGPWGPLVSALIP